MLYQSKEIEQLEAMIERQDEKHFKMYSSLMESYTKLRRQVEIIIITLFSIWMVFLLVAITFGVVKLFI